jgi:hypothetical protein
MDYDYSYDVFLPSDGVFATTAHEHEMLSTYLDVR